MNTPKDPRAVRTEISENVSGLEVQPAFDGGRSSFSTSNGSVSDVGNQRESDAKDIADAWIPELTNFVDITQTENEFKEKVNSFLAVISHVLSMVRAGQITKHQGHKLLGDSLLSN